MRFPPLWFKLIGFITYAGFDLVINIDKTFILVIQTCHLWWILILSFVLTGFLSLWFKLITCNGFLSRHLYWWDFYPCDLNLSHAMDFYLVIFIDGIFILVIKLITCDGFLSHHLYWRDFYPCDLNLRVFITVLGFLTSSFILTEAFILASSFQFKGNCLPWNDLPLSMMKAVLQTFGLLYSSLLIKIGYKDINLWQHKSATDKVLNRKWNKCIMKIDVSLIYV